MASPRGYEHLEPTEDPHAAAAAQAALEAQVLATQEARRAKLEVSQAEELAQQERLREAMREAQLVGVTSAVKGDWRDGLAVRAPHEPDPAPPAWTWPAAQPWDPQYTRPQPVSAGNAARERGIHDAVDHVEPKGLGSKQREQLGFANAEASAGAVEPAAREGGAREEAKADRCDGGHAQGVTENVLPVNQALVQAWWDWMDSESAAIGLAWEPASLTALATVDYANSIDTDFVDRVISEIDDPADGAFFSRRGGEIWSRWQAHRAQRPKTSAAELEALRAHLDQKWPHGSDGSRPDVGARVQIIEDRGHIFAGGDPQAYVRDYLRTVPIGWSESIVVSLRKSERVVICRWSAERVRRSDTVTWAEHGPRIDDRQRFVALRDHDFDGAARVMIPASQPVSAPLSLAELASPQTAAPATRIHPTGIGPLDAALATGGLPTAARVVIQATTGSGKTVAMLEIAESFAARGLRVCWIATGDDDAAAIKARRRQRLGIGQAEALCSADESALDPRLMIFDGRNVSLEAVLRFKHEIDLLVVDPITKVVTACTSADPVVRVGYALDLIEAAGVTTIMGVPTVRGAARRAQNERGLGGQRVESGAHLLLELARKGGDLTLSIGKSRYGGEGLEIPLRLDAERQRVTGRACGVGAPPANAVRAEDRIWGDVQRLLVDRGPRTARSLTEGITGKAETIRAVVRQRLAAGELVQEGREVRLS